MGSLIQGGPRDYLEVLPGPGTSDIYAPKRRRDRKREKEDRGRKNEEIKILQKVFIFYARHIVKFTHRNNS